MKKLNNFVIIYDKYGDWGLGPIPNHHLTIKLI
jgi:hypothetical protein